MRSSAFSERQRWQDLCVARSAFCAAAPDIAADQWEFFIQIGRFKKMFSAEAEKRFVRLSPSKGDD
ncbi:hypothetical protein Z949_3769 [Sulfitobacter guttiformis KCTC 32187]|nr:hypothetical protein Z949_3769 [Sulfitobacter guttiformis KCTC 32187]